MTWADFRRWATGTYGYQFGWPLPNGSEWRAMWGKGMTFGHGRTGTGSGNPAEYGPLQQRRFTFWLRARPLIDPDLLHSWVDQAEHYESGWLVNDGRGPRWIADPESEAHELVQRGFVAIKCGL